MNPVLMRVNGLLVKMRMKKMKRVSPTNARELKLQILVHVNGLAIKIPVIRYSVAGNLEG